VVIQVFGATYIFLGGGDLGLQWENCWWYGAAKILSNGLKTRESSICRGMAFYLKAVY